MMLTVLLLVALLAASSVCRLESESSCSIEEFSFTPSSLRNVTLEARKAQTDRLIKRYQMRILMDRAHKGYFDYSTSINSHCVFDDVLEGCLDFFKEKGFSTKVSIENRNTTSERYEFCQRKFLEPGTFVEYYNVHISWDEK